MYKHATSLHLSNYANNDVFAENKIQQKTTKKQREILGVNCKNLNSIFIVVYTHTHNNTKWREGKKKSTRKLKGNETLIARSKYPSMSDAELCFAAHPVCAAMP